MTIKFTLDKVKVRKRAGKPSQVHQSKVKYDRKSKSFKIVDYSNLRNK